MSEWISVQDKLPEIGFPVIATLQFRDGAHWYGCCIYRGFFPWFNIHKEYSITHWMPLPEPPKEEHDHDPK